MVDCAPKAGIVTVLVIATFVFLLMVLSNLMDAGKKKESYNMLTDWPFWAAVMTGACGVMARKVGDEYYGCE